MNDMVRIIRSGDDHLVPLPEGYRFENGEVFVRREGNRVILESAAEAIDTDTGLPIAELRRLIQAGADSGPGRQWDAEGFLARVHDRS